MVRAKSAKVFGGQRRSSRTNSYGLARHGEDTETIDSYESTILTPARKLILSRREDIWCIVDEEDYKWAIQWLWNWSRGGHPWNKSRYAKRNIGKNRTTIWLHRAVLMRAQPRPDWFCVSHIADHLNGQSLDNRRANLRWATHAENAKNRTKTPPPSLEWIWQNLCIDTDGGTSLELECIPF
jgi:hypothetical protein